MADDAPWRMSSIFARHSGVPAVIWVATKGEEQHECSIKVGKTPAWTGESFSITVPELQIIGKVLCDANALKKAKEFVVVNQSNLLSLWNAQIDFVEFVQGMKRV